MFFPQKLHTITYGNLDFFLSAVPTAKNSPEFKINL